MHAVHKEDSTASKFRIVFDTSAIRASGTLLNEHVLIGPSVHPLLIEVLLGFRKYKVTLTTNVSRMYQAIQLPNCQKDLHRFKWREDPKQQLKHYRMTRLTFLVTTSSFAANMALRQNTLNHLETHPQAARVALESFYTDDGLIGTDTVPEAIRLRRTMQQLFKLGGFNI